MRLSLAVLIAVLLVPASARAFCRTTTSSVPADYDPSEQGCWPNGLPVYWANACVSYDIQQDASKQVSYDTAAQIIATAFSKWTSTVCSSSGNAPARVSIDVRDFGPVACNQVQYNQDGPNQHVIIFDDEMQTHDGGPGFPGGDTSNALALTTVTYNLDTGEIYDADMQINSSQAIQLSTSETVPPGGYDLASIVTHETGHFLGMAHSQDDLATMYAHYTPGQETMRFLTEDDIDGICTIYEPNGDRAVAKAASATGLVMEDACDPTPRHGFSTQCMNQGGGGCSTTGEPALRPWHGLALLFAVGLRRRRRRR